MRGFPSDAKLLRHQTPQHGRDTDIFRRDSAAEPLRRLVLRVSVQ